MPQALMRLGGKQLDEWRTKGASVEMLLAMAQLTESAGTTQPTLL